MAKREVPIARSITAELCAIVELPPSASEQQATKADELHQPPVMGGDGPPST
jgi:hypothetical protein